MALLFLIRHGLTAQTGHVLYGRLPGIGLDHRGRAQAEALVERFRGIRLTAAYASPLERCMETLEPLAAANGLTIRPHEALLEMDAGSWTGRRLSAVRRQKAWATVQRTPSAFSFPGGGEGFADAQRRVIDELLSIARRHARGRVAVATHGDIVRIALAHFLGTPLDRFQRIVADPISVSVVHVRKGDGRVLLVNDAGGLGVFGSSPVAPWEAADASAGRLRG